MSIKVIEMSPLIQRIKKIEDVFLFPLERSLLAVCAITIILLITFHIAMRYIGQSRRWTEEAARLLTIWGTFFAIPLFIRERRLLKIDFFINLLPLKVKTFIHLLTDCCIGVFSLYLIYYGYRTVLFQWTHTSPGLTWPMSIFSLPIALFSILIIIHLIPNLYQDAKTLLDKKGADS